MQSDYCITIDDEWALDGAERAEDVETWSGCHINHSRSRYNVCRRTLRKERRVQLFAARKIECALLTRVKRMYASKSWYLMRCMPECRCVCLPK